jgi:hypothetical protein
MRQEIQRPQKRKQFRILDIGIAEGKVKQRWLQSTAALLLACITWCSAYGADSSAVQFELRPATVELAAKETIQILAFVRNSTDSIIRNIQLAALNHTDCEVDIPDPRNAKVEAHGALLLPITIRQAATGRMRGKIYFQLTYTKKAAANSDQTVKDVALAPLEIQSHLSESVDKVAKLQIETALEEIQEHRKGTIFLTITNIANVPVAITDVKSYSANFIKPDLTKTETAVSVPPQTSRTFIVPMTVEDNAQTGKERVVFEVMLSWIEAGRISKGMLQAAYTVNVGILGVSDLLKILGVPSFLFVPGFLVLTTFFILRERVSPGIKIQPEAALTAPELGVLSVTISIVVAGFYPVITRLSGRERNYLSGYGAQDIVWVWFGSLAAGVIFWMIWVGGGGLIQKYKKMRRERKLSEQQTKELEQIAARMPKKTDTPVVLLEKMAKNAVPFPLSQAEIQENTAVARCFIVLPPQNGTSIAWVSPPILVKPKPAIVKTGTELTNAKTPSRAAEWLRALELASDDNPAALADLLRVPPEGWVVLWGSEAFINAPTPIEEKQIRRLDGVNRRLFVERA